MFFHVILTLENGVCWQFLIINSLYNCHWFKRNCLKTETFSFIQIRELNVLQKDALGQWIKWHRMIQRWTHKVSLDILWPHTNGSDSNDGCTSSCHKSDELLNYSCSKTFFKPNKRKVVYHNETRKKNLCLTFCTICQSSKFAKNAVYYDL